jgi:predicted transcriptional regulator
MRRNGTDMATQLSVRLDTDLEERLQTYITDDRHDFEPRKSDVVRGALDDYLPDQTDTT